MPKWGLSMEDGAIVHWYVDEGTPVEKGADLVDIETTKITNTLEAPASGVLRRRIAETSVTYPCGALIAVIAKAIVSDAEIDAFIADRQATSNLSETVEEKQEAEPQTVQARGLSLRYLQEGTGETPIVFLHGFGGDLGNWVFVQLGLESRARTIAFDLPGHGGSGKSMSGIASLGDLASVMLDALDATGIPRAHVVGHSMGGLVAALMVEQEPERMASLTLLAPPGFGPSVDSAFLDEFIAARKRPDMVRVASRLFNDPGLVGRDMIKALLRYKRLDGVEAALRLLADALKNVEVNRGVQALSGYAGPVKIVWGAADAVIPAPDPNAFPSGIQVQLLDTVGHMPHLEAAAGVITAIEGYL
jgi:pyruvate dehydrogenase E2 component (dihydrolipoamide acetyltransferase)